MTMEYRDFYKNKKATPRDIQSLLPEGVDAKEFRKGINVEKEHTNDDFSAAKLACENLKSDPRYYTKLQEQVEEHCGACEDDMGEEETIEGYDDNGGTPKVGGALAVPHLGQPIRLGKIIQVGAEFGKGSASGELSGMSNCSGKIAKDTGGIPVQPENDKETITAGGKKVDGSIASKSVGGSVVPGEGQKQGGLNSKGGIAGTPQLTEQKTKVRGYVKDVLKEITFDKKSGKWVRLTESKHKAGCECGFCKNKNKFSKKGKSEEKDKEDVDEGMFDVFKKKSVAQTGNKIGPNSFKYLANGSIATFLHRNSPTGTPVQTTGYVSGWDDNGLYVKPKGTTKDERISWNDVRRVDSSSKTNETVNMKMGKSYKTVQPRQYKVSDDDVARTNQYTPEITEMYDDEERYEMNERYVELANAQRNLSESELSELKNLREKIDDLAEKKMKEGLFSRFSKKPADVKSSPLPPKPGNPNDCPMCAGSGKPSKRRLPLPLKPGEKANPNADKCPACRGSGKKLPPGLSFPNEEQELEEETGMCDCGAQDKGEHTPHKDSCSVYKVEEGRCEDFPCCGHESGDCPDRGPNGEEIWKCVSCGRKLPTNANSSICDKCQRRMSQEDGDDYHYTPGNERYGGDYPDLEETVDMKMGPSYKTVQPRQYKVSDDDVARTNQYDPEVSEEIEIGNDVGEKVRKGHKGQSGFRTWVCKGCGEQLVLPLTNRKPDDKKWTDGHICHFEPERKTSTTAVSEAGGQSVQHRSFRTAQDAPQNPKIRWNDEVSESKKPSKVARVIKKGMKIHKAPEDFKHKKPKKISTGVHKRKT